MSRADPARENWTNTLPPIRAKRVTEQAVRMVERTFEAFTIDDSGTWSKGAIAAPCLADAVAEVAPGCIHGEKLAIREEGPNGVKVHLYAIRKKSAPVRVYRGHRYVNTYPLYADPICTIDGAAFAGTKAISNQGAERVEQTARSE